MATTDLVRWLRQLPQVVQFAAVGGAAAATHLALVFALVQGGGMPPLQANVIAFLVAFVVSYNGHACLTFAAHQARGWRVVGRYFAVACLSFVVNEWMYWAALHWLGWHYLWSLFAVLLLVAAGTFVLSKFWAFQGGAREHAAPKR